MGRIFGTDGIRGVAGVDMTPELALDLGRAAATVVKERGNPHPHFLIGRDTRISGGMLESAIAAGLCSVGADVTLLGVIPTPGVAYLARKYQADGAFVISASHNPYEYNGIKLFDAEGYKFPDSYEEEIEELILDDLRPYALVDGQDFGRIRTDSDAGADYVEYLASTAPARAEGLRVLVDCANGAASATAKELFTAVGADFTLINDTPDGININVDCGSTHIEQLCPWVVEGGYDLGIAFDGDADRIIAVDERGEVVDGDMLLAVFACYLISQDQLAQRTVVGTVMSNIGLLKFGEMSDVHIETTKVGDRYVLERMPGTGLQPGRRTVGAHHLPGLYAHRRCPALCSAAVGYHGENRPEAVRAGSGDEEIPPGAGECQGQPAGQGFPAGEPSAAGADRRVRSPAGQPGPGAGAPIRDRAAGPGDAGGRGSGRDHWYGRAAIGGEDRRRVCR